MKLLKHLIIILLISFCLTDCSTVKTVSKNQLMSLTHKWKEPKVAIWYYIGTKKNYHYFSFIDLGYYRYQYYRVKTTELIMKKTFPLTKNEKKWKSMPWGPYRIDRIDKNKEYEYYLE